SRRRQPTQLRRQRLARAAHTARGAAGGGRGPPRRSRRRRSGATRHGGRRGRSRSARGAGDREPAQAGAKPGGAPAARASPATQGRRRRRAANGPALGDAGIELYVRGESVAIDGDGALLERLIENLLTSALRQPHDLGRKGYAGGGSAELSGRRCSS